MPYISKSFAHIANVSFITGIVTEILKFYLKKVIPLYLFCHASLKFLNALCLITCTACWKSVAFSIIVSTVSEHSTELALAHARDTLCASLDKKNTSIGIFLDHSQAFDNINHDILFNKLSSMAYMAMQKTGSVVILPLKSHMTSYLITYDFPSDIVSHI